MAYKQFIALGFSLCSISVINSQFFSVPYWTSYSTSNNPSYQTSINNRETFTQPQSFSSSSSSCNEYFSYQNDFNGQYGLVSIPVPSGSSQIHLKVKLSLAARLSSDYVGTIDLAKDKMSSASDVANGQPLQYRINFPLQNPMPKPFEIFVNEQLLCSAAKDVASYVTTIMLDHTFITGASGLSTGPFVPRPQRPAPIPTRGPTYTQLPPIATQPPLTQQTPQIDNGNFQCGNTDYAAPTSTGLVIGGQVVRRGQFPWMAAYYHNGRGDSRFICGGSLISTKIIVTAAHCIQAKRDTVAKRADEATFYMGKHNLENLSGEPNYQLSGVTKFIVHPEWQVNDDRYDADIAIAVLLRTISFTKFVKPICLWTSTSSYDDLIGKKGVVAGWGKTEFDAVSTAQPNWASLPVVSESTCLRSNDAFSALTSSRTFCAGDRNGKTGPCLGDSGGGFVVQDGSKWYLRGLVSSSLIDANLQTCDTRNYAVFTDITRFNSWIQGFIRLNG